MWCMAENTDLFGTTIVTGGIDAGTAQIVFGIENAGRSHLYERKQTHNATENQSVGTHNPTLSS